MNSLSNSSQAFIDAYREQDNDAPWLASLKQSALESFSKSGFPTSRNEAWKYTSLKHLDHKKWTVAPIDTSVNEVNYMGVKNSHRLVFVNGRFNKELSVVNNIPDGAFIGPLGEALISQRSVLETYLCRIAEANLNPLLALNTAYMEDGFVLVLRNVVLSEPVEIVHLGQANGQDIAYHPRNLVILDDVSKATIIEQFTGSDLGGYFANSAMEILVDGRSQLNHHRVFEDGDASTGVSSTVVEIGNDACYESLVLSCGGNLLRNDLRIRLGAAGAQAKVGGVYLANRSQHVDHTTLIEHAEPNTTSSQLFKGALNEKARGVFQGNIIVRKGADGSNGHLDNRILLLSPGAEANSKPQLEIYADDVKCSHGSTIGELDEEAMFYLRSRGISENQAKSILIKGFLSEVIEQFDLRELLEIFNDRIGDWMRAS